MLTIALGAYETFPTDQYGKSAAGWRPGLTDHQVYESGRGRWKLGARANSERYALFTAKGIVVLAVEINSIGAPDADGRRTITGTVLQPGDPVYDKYVGEDPPVGRSQNPIQYIETPFDRTECACGCGNANPPGRTFVPGHDQKALHERVAKVGGVAAFLHWFDQTWTGEAVGATTTDGAE
ncbi:hypothetical protein ACFRKE_01005 [Kitasatospora indigofera]|uniref:hypothetical protein n=1 Tax=Kitasatospora indigofera TaxID=67307 RepID=UPI00363F3599